MEHRAFGQTDLKAPILGFGAARLPEYKPGRFDAERSAPILRRAIDLGVNYIDSAAVYGMGTSEAAVGLAIQGYDRSTLYLTTKIPSSTPAQARPATWRKRLDASLRRLNTPYIDFLFLHGITWQAFRDIAAKPGSALDAARHAQSEGLIRHLCFSSHDTADNIIRLIDTGEFEGILVQYNYLDRHNEPVIAHAAAKGLGVSIMGPLGAGRLATSTGAVADYGRALGLGAPELALRFVWDNPGVTVALSGMSDVAQVEHNVAAAERHTAAGRTERNKIRRFFQRMHAQADAYCTYCGACLPCPRRVNIPENFRYMNWHRVWGLESEAKAMYARLGQRRRWEPWGVIDGRNASACNGCGKCESRCPLGIPIAEQLREVAATLAE